MTRFEPVVAEIKETVIGPVARGGEEDEKEKRAVDAGPVQEIGRDKEQEYEGG